MEAMTVGLLRYHSMMILKLRNFVSRFRHEITASTKIVFGFLSERKYLVPSCSLPLKPEYEVHAMAWERVL